MAHIDIRIELDEFRDEDFPDDAPYFRVSRVSRVDSTLPDSAELSMQEYLVQSDFGSIEFPNAIIDAISGEVTDFSDRYK